MSPTPWAQAVQTINKALAPAPQHRLSQSNDDNAEETGLFEDLQRLKIDDFDTLKDVLEASISGEEDDNELLLERIVTFLARLPPRSRQGRRFTEAFINQLWDVLEHPPPQLRSEATRYRSADGSYNNPTDPSMGAANTRYARTVTARTFQLPDLPDPALIFDSLMDRGDGSSFREHPNKISSMLFYLATIITHDIFQTDSKDPNFNLTSSYLDLSPLYGRNAEEQSAMRTFEDGLLQPDCFSSRSLYGFPPGLGVFLIMFNRFHNYVVTQLAEINEGGRFTKPPSRDAAHATAWAKYDDDLFQTGRLITCGLYVNIVLKDYVRTILNLNRTGSTWGLDPRVRETKDLFNSSPAPQATGNQVSVEFNLIYRWHSAISQRDAAWTEDELRRGLREVAGDDADPTTAPLDAVLRAIRALRENIPEEPRQRVFAGLERGSDGTYDDNALVRLLADSVEDVAGAFGAHQVPRALRAIEILGIRQARGWHVATLNELRQYFGLRRHATFADINPDPVVAARLAALYGAPDAVELYPGLVAEKAKPPMPGSGLCVNVTTSRAILSDAVALVRGDRFYTADYTPTNLTNWGYREADFDLEVNQGQVIYKLILRAFPNHFAENSIYAHFPFVIPAENKAIHDALGTSELYSWTRPSNEAAPTDPTQLLSLPSPLPQNWTRIFDECLYAPPRWDREVASFVARTTSRLLARAAQPVPGLAPTSSPSRTATTTTATTTTTYEADVLADVTGPLAARLTAALLALPLDPSGADDAALYAQLAGLAAPAFFAPAAMDPGAAFRARVRARAPAAELAQHVRHEATAAAGTRGGWVAGLVAWLGRRRDAREEEQEEEEEEQEDGAHGSGPDDAWPSLPRYGRRMLARLAARGVPPAEVADEIVLIGADLATTLSTRLAQCLDYALEPAAGTPRLPALRRLARAATPAADDELARQLLSPLPPAQASPPSSSFASATDPAAPLLRAALVAAFKALALAGDAGPRRAPGPRGRCSRCACGPWRGQVGREADGRLTAYLTPDHGAFAPAPATMRIRWDESGGVAAT
ncbi:linoleate diol synthase precursor [Durotheca rogersii]|uniref:linoleate diol synthase precursor n=1 Tax=Durotheca rogersii TaxID=419775 RepID=UPI0022200BD7|nr:linoleate diol synthase precursor [Durotheca rogersii]KAI5867841.1 linoleate diol synthase precursor [Durotheca rogersii]